MNRAGGNAMSSSLGSRKSFHILALVSCLALIGLLAPGASGQPAGLSLHLPVHLIAHAINMGVTVTPAPPGVAGQPGINLVEITITRWSTPQERAALVAALTQKGQQGLLDALTKTPSVGTIRTPDKLGWDLHYSHQVPTAAGGVRIFLATVRRITFWEEIHRPPSINYPFTLIELHLDASGHGEGKMSVATKIRAVPDGGYIELEDYATQAVQLESVAIQDTK
jgi:hypothetical protein